MLIWQTMTAPQATVIAGGMTVVAASVGVLLGWLLFTGKVSDLKSALTASDQLLQTHKSEVERVLQEIKSQLAGVPEQLQTLISGQNELRGDVGDIQSSQEEGIIEEAPFKPRQASDGTSLRLALRENWFAIRDRLEQIASDPEIDGRTRARYGRIDRRKFLELIETLFEDRLISASQLDEYRDAVQLWNRFKSGRLTPSPSDLDRMAMLRNIIVQ